MELGLRDPGHRHAHLHRVVPGQVLDLRAAQARQQPVHADRAGRRRCVQEATRRGATKVAGNLIGSEGGVRIFTHKGGQFTNC